MNTLLKNKIILLSAQEVPKAERCWHRHRKHVNNRDGKRGHSDYEHGEFILTVLKVALLPS